MSDVAAADIEESAKPMAAQTETILEHINQGNQELATSVKADLKQVLREFSAIIDDRFKEHEKLMWAAFATYRPVTKTNVQQQQQQQQRQQQQQQPPKQQQQQEYEEVAPWQPRQQDQHQQQMDKVRKRDDDAPPMLPSRKFAADAVIPREVIDHFATQSDRDPQRMQRASGASLAPPLSHGGMEGDSIFPNAGEVAFTSVAAEATASHPLTVSRSVADVDPMFVSTTGTRRADSVEAKVPRSIKPSLRQQPPQQVELEVDPLSPEHPLYESNVQWQKRFGGGWGSSLGSNQPPQIHMQPNVGTRFLEALHSQQQVQQQQQQFSRFGLDDKHDSSGPLISGGLQEQGRMLRP